MRHLTKYKCFDKSINLVPLCNLREDRFLTDKETDHCDEMNRGGSKETFCLYCIIILQNSKSNLAREYYLFLVNYRNPYDEVRPNYKIPS